MPFKTNELAKACLSMLLLFICSNIFAQTTVTGRVTSNADKQPVAGATVQVKGTKVATQTNPDGTFSITSSKAIGTLIITAVGFEPFQIPVEGRTSIGEVSLAISSTSLNDVVVTGYTSQRKKDITGSVTVVNVADMNRQPTGQINNQLQGQAAGVTVIGSGQPGEEPIVRIRGVNTFGNNTPLYVIDGVPTQNISDINPNDVASMQILKDAGAASIYGSRANNGVIIITTKKGSGKVKVSYDGYYGTQRPKGGNVWNILSPQETAQLKFNALTNSGSVINDPLYGTGPTPVLPDYIYPTGAHEGDPSVDPSKYYVNPDYTDPNDFATFYRINKANKAGTDWYHEVNKPAPIQNHNISVSGGGDLGRYFFSLDYFNQQGSVIYTYLKRYTIRANTQFNISKSIRVGENLAYSITDNPTIGALAEGSTIGYAFREQPIIPVRDIMGNFAGTYGGQLGNANNPVATAYRTRNNQGLSNRLFGNIYADVDIIKGLTLHTSFGGESYAGYYHSFNYPSYENAENTSTNSYYESSYYGYNWTWTNTLTYHRKFGEDHDFQILVGTEAYDNRGRNLSGTTYSYFSFDPNYVNLSTGSGTVQNSSSQYSDGLWSQFGQINYSYKERYILSAILRRDGSSKFLTYQYGWFPSVSAAWRVSSEDFMKSVTWINDLKIRAGWGVMGNQLNVNAGNAFDTYNADKNASYYDIAGSNNSIQQGFRVGQVGNPDAKWEKDINSNIGIDATFLNGKLELIADYYQKDIKDLLYNPSLPGTQGQGTPPYVNVSKMKNHGLDISLGGHFNVAKDLKLDANVSITTYNNKVVKITDGSDYFLIGDGRRFGESINRNQVGQPVGAFYGYKIAGFFKDSAEILDLNSKAPSGTFEADAKAGRFRYADLNGDGQITPDDRTFLGNPNPKFSYGINLGLTYKAFDFSVFLYGVHGNQIWNQVKWWLDFYPSFAGGKSKTALYDSWTPSHQNAKVVIQENAGFFSSNGTANSYYVESGAYLRAKNMQIGYTLPHSPLKRIGVDNLRVYVQAANVFTITKYSGTDPEITGSKTSADFGIDEGPYPSTREFLIGVNLKF